VANPNLGSETTPEIVRSGLGIIMKAAEEIGIPVVGTGVRQDLVTDVGQFWSTYIPNYYYFIAPVVYKSRRHKRPEINDGCSSGTRDYFGEK
jgi:hypothetical protein